MRRFILTFALVIFAKIVAGHSNIVVVGDGLAGFNMAYHLVRNGRAVTIIGEDAMSASKNNAGMLSPASYGLISESLSEQVGKFSSHRDIVQFDYANNLLTLHGLGWHYHFIKHALFSKNSEKKKQLFHVFQSSSVELLQALKNNHNLH